MKKTERIKRKPVIKAKDIPTRRLSSISSLKNRKSVSSSRELLEENAAKVKEKLRENIPDDTENEINENESMSVLEDATPSVIQTFSPQLYHFRLPGASNLPLDSSSAETPPYWLLLDHALGVIWTLFSAQQQKSGLGVSELHWALEFLKGIRSSRGENPKDVKICINAIEDKLIELYAKISNKSEGLNEKSSNATNTSTSNASLVPSDCQGNVSGSSIGRYMENMRKRSVLSTSATKFPQQYPLSVTYEEILNRSPRSVQQLYKAGPKGFHASEGVIIEESMDLEQSKSSVSVPYDKLVDFLSDWRKEQVDRIQTELKRLHSIEQFMGTLEKEDFQPYVDGRLPQKLNELKASIAADLSTSSAFIPALSSKQSKLP